MGRITKLTNQGLLSILKDSDRQKWLESLVVGDLAILQKFPGDSIFPRNAEKWRYSLWKIKRIETEEFICMDGSGELLQIRRSSGIVVTWCRPTYNGGVIIPYLTALHRNKSHTLWYDDRPYFSVPPLQEWGVYVED